MNMTEQDCFFVAAFAVDGRLEGVHQWVVGSMSEKWLELCGEYLDHHGSNFNASWGGELARISTKFTADRGVALVTFSSDGKPLASILLASGKSKDADLSVMKLFINSLIAIDEVQRSAVTDEPFREMLSIPDRPLMVVIPWVDESVDAQEHTLVRELSLHLAAAYFLRLK
jgi:hypothetical protein